MNKNNVKIEELINPFSKLRELIRKVLRNNFETDEGWLYVQDVFTSHPVLGNVAIVEHSMDSSLYAVEWLEEDNGSVKLATVENWKKVMQQYTLIDTTIPTIGEVDSDVTEVDVEFNETVAISIEEDADGVKDLYSPLDITLRVIKEGFGNARDNHYYGRQQLEADASKFVGVMMYTTNHVSKETNEPNQVAKITEAKWDSNYNGIVAKATIFDPMFARKTRNRKAAGMLEELHVSIRSSGTSYAKPYIKDGRKGRLVKEFTEVKTVDFVSRAGAGGNVIDIS